MAHSYCQNNTLIGKIEYAGISYRSVGGIRYYYRVLGLDSTWRETSETFLEYPALPSGKYRFQLRAVNKFGFSSAVLTLPFFVTAPFWETGWFDAIIFIIFALLAWFAAGWRVRIIRRRQKEKEHLLKGMAEMENRALQAQMNPHFIFNCLNSIQQFIFDQDVWATNKYITGFARLVRATLHNSSRSLIPLSGEIDYLSTYLSLEKMRFKDKMDYFIDVEPAIDKERTLLPPMLVQPYVENAMRHGLRHKTNGNGYIRITMRLLEGQLVIIVEDNGIGRKKSMEYKTGEHIEYQSRGMSMTADRMKMIGAMYGRSIHVEVEDPVSDGFEPAGTRVIIHLPQINPSDGSSV